MEIKNDHVIVDLDPKLDPGRHKKLTFRVEDQNGMVTEYPVRPREHDQLWDVSEKVVLFPMKLVHYMIFGFLAAGRIGYQRITRKDEEKEHVLFEAPKAQQIV